MTDDKKSLSHILVRGRASVWWGGATFLGGLRECSLFTLGGGKT